MTLTSTFRSDAESWDEASIETWPDVQTIPVAGFGGKECKLMYEKQMESVGCKSWASRPHCHQILERAQELEDDDVDDLDDPGVLSQLPLGADPSWTGMFGLDDVDNERAQLRGSVCFDDEIQNKSCGVHIRMYNQAADQGPDQISMDALVRAALKLDPFAWKLLEACICHIAQIIVERQLRLTNKYWSNSAKCVHTWRGTGNAKVMCAWWTKAHGPEGAAKVFGSLPPRPLKGRWGAIYHTETHFLKAKMAPCSRAYRHLAEVMDAKRSRRVAEDLSSLGSLEALADGQDVQLSSKAASAAMAIVEADNDTAHSLVVGRWMRDSVAAVQDPDWWATMYIRHKTGGPIEHLMRWQAQGGAAGLKALAGPLDGIEGDYNDKNNDNDNCYNSSDDNSNANGNDSNNNKADDNDNDSSNNSIDKTRTKTTQVNGAMRRASSFTKQKSLLLSGKICWFRIF